MRHGAGRCILKPLLIKSDLQIIQQMTQCLALGKENLMTPKYNCVEFGSGESEAQASNMPLGEDEWTKVCATKDEPRGLRADTVKRLAQSHDIAPTGIESSAASFAMPSTSLGLIFLTPSSSTTRCSLGASKLAIFG